MTQNLCKKVPPPMGWKEGRTNILVREKNLTGEQRVRGKKKAGEERSKRAERGHMVKKEKRRDHVNTQ